MSHEMASLLLAETIIYSRKTSKQPLFALFLDAKTAFDRVVKEILIEPYSFLELMIRGLSTLTSDCPIEPPTAILKRR